MDLQTISASVLAIVASILFPCAVAEPLRDCSPTKALSALNNDDWKPDGLDQEKGGNQQRQIDQIERSMSTAIVRSGENPDDAAKLAATYIESGSTAPRKIVWPAFRILQKIIPVGGDLKPYSGFWSTPETIEIEMTRPRDIGDDFALPPSTAGAPAYDVYEIWSPEPVEVYESLIAGADEQPICWHQNGGALKILVRNRNLFVEPRYVTTVRLGV